MKFGIWDKELNDLIQSLHAKLAISEQALKDWFYTDGILIFQASQAELNAEDQKVSMEKHNHRPTVTYSSMLGQKTQGFIQLQLAATKKFAPEEPARYKIFLAEFCIFSQTALQNHTSFYRLQALITTEMNQKSDVFYKFLPEGGPLGFVCGKFREYQTTMPDLAEDIADHLEFIDQFARLKARRDQNDLLSLFKPAASTPADSAASSAPVATMRGKEEKGNIADLRKGMTRGG